MNEAPGRQPYTWKEGAFNVSWDRVVVSVEGNTLTIDAPLTTALEARLGGGTVTINAASTSLATTVDMSITNCTFYNDMTNGHGSDPTVKGHAALLSGTTRSFQTFTGNEWFDGIAITRQTEGGFTIYR